MENNLLVLEKQSLPQPPQTYMVAGFYQEANAGNVSIGIPEHLIKKLSARKIGHILKDDFYDSSAVVSYEDGYEKMYQEPQNDYYYTTIGDTGLVIFIGSSPSHHLEKYANTLLDGAQELHVRRTVSVAGRWSEVPFDKERTIGTTYSLQDMKEELDKYTLLFPSYSRYVDHNSVINHHARQRNMELVRMSARVPGYRLQGNDGNPLLIQSDYKAYLDILRRVRHMFRISLDLSDLETASEQLINQWHAVFSRMIVDPGIRRYLEEVETNFKELKFEEPVELAPNLQGELDQILRKQT